MGEALLRGWIAANIKSSYIVVEPSGLKKKPKSVRLLKKPGADIKQCDVVVLAVKPQVMDDVCNALKPFLAKNTLVLSIAAGRTIQSFEKTLGKTQPIIRSMPNLPAAIGKSMTVAVANKHVTAAQKKIANTLLGCVGKVEWVKNEKLMDSVTAVSGSGPAYVFHLIETLAKAGEKAGFDKNTAMTLARQTVIGSAALAESTPDINAATLRQNVTSPGGTTEAALKILMDGRMQDIFDAAIDAARKRGKELNG